MFLKDSDEEVKIMSKNYNNDQQTGINNNNNTPRSRPYRKSKKPTPKRGILKIIICFALFVSLIIIGWQARRLFPYPTVLAHLGIENWQVWEFHDYFGLDPNVVNVVLESQRLTDLISPVIINGEVYFHHSFVREFIDPFVFWDESAQSLFFSTDTEVFRKPDMELVPAGLLREMYPYFLINHQQEHNMVVIEDFREPAGRSALTTGRSTPIRYRPSNTAYITQHVPRDTPLILFYEVYQEGDFIRVRTPEGLLGYAPVDALTTSLPSTPIEGAPPRPLPNFPIINLTWEMITTQAANYVLMSTPLPEGLNVISPTWFYFDSDTLAVTSHATHSYVEWAHNYGVQVWPRIFDSNSDISHRVLTDYRIREQAISQLIQLVEEYNLDGININFEFVPRTDGGYYVQFLRELAPKMREIGAVLSVATFVPAPWFQQYHHDLVGKTVDFVAIMTYDEHYPGSPEPGPVASLPFVERSVRDALALIPRERLILCLPFYNRLWNVMPDGTHGTNDIGMARPWALVEEWGVTPTWDPVLGYYYVNFNSNFNGTDNITYRIWIECERSIGEKLNIFQENELAGVASWRRGLETPGVWEQIRQVIR